MQAQYAHINGILIDMNVNCVLLLWKNKQRKKDNEQCSKKLSDKNDDQLL